MQRTVKWALAGVAALAVAVPAAFASGAVAGRDEYEAPKYEVEEIFEDFEVRAYARRIVAEVEIEGAPKRATSSGFRILAGYIFGGNVSKESVAMTAPVDRQRSEEIAMTVPVDRQKRSGRWTITFTMPAKYTLETLPTPIDDRVVLREVPPKRVAAVQFSGAPSERRVHKRMDALLEAVEAAGLQTAGNSAVYSRFDPPWTLPFMRHNEITLELAPQP